MQEKVLNIIKEELAKRGIKVIKIILFGSRARGDFQDDSDWDLMVIVDKDLQPHKSREITGEIYRLLAKLEDNYEIIIKSYSSFEKMKQFAGCVSYDADKEGMVVWKS
ncbi:MAG: nucleotidyltransferase domain-containing protein [Thermodesulfobacteriota bacterium]